MLTLLFLLIQITFAIAIIFLTLAFVTGAPFVPSTRKTAEKMIELAELRKGMKVYDLGSGDGRLLKLAAERGARATGFEINPYLVIFTKIRFFFSPYRNLIKAKWADFWRADFRDADAVFVYLLPWKMEKLENLLKEKLKPGATVVSNSFIFPHLKMIRKDESVHVYVFKVD